MQTLTAVTDALLCSPAIRDEGVNRWALKKREVLYDTNQITLSIINETMIVKK